MEDIRRRTSFNNVHLQIQAMEKLFSEVKKKRPGGRILTSSTSEYVELKTLWQYAGDEHAVVARHACSLWIQLLQENGAEFTYVLNGFLNQVPAAKNLQGIIKGVSDLLELQILLKIGAGESYMCPYTIRNPPHPFITILINRPEDAWPLLLDQVTTFFMHTNKSVSNNAIPCLDPVLKFILLAPRGSDQHNKIRMLLKTTLIGLLSQMTDRNSKNSCFTYLLQLISEMQFQSSEIGDVLLFVRQHFGLSFMLRKNLSTGKDYKLLKMGSKVEVAEVSSFCIQLLDCYKQQTSELDVSLGIRLGNLTISLIVLSHQHDLGITTLCKRVIDTGKDNPLVLAADCNLSALSELMLVVYPTDNLYLLDIVMLILKSTDDVSWCAGFIYMAAINIVAAPSVVYQQHQKVIVTKATEIISLLQSKRHSDNVQIEDGSQTGLLTVKIYTSQTIVRLARTFTNDNNNSLLEQWLHHLEHIIPRLTSVPLCLTNLLVCVLMQSEDTNINTLAVTRLTDMAKHQPTQAPFFLPVYLFALNNKRCPLVKLCIMEALPKLAVHKYCVPQVLKVIQSLGQSPNLKGLSLRLLTDLWKIQSRCYPMLLSAITEYKSGRTEMATVTDDVVMARAAAVREICRLKPEQHGSELLTQISDILDSCVDKRGAAAAALALEALYYICQAEVIDIVSTWGVLENKLVKDTRPIVIEKICDLLSLVPQLPASSKTYEVFLEETIRRLWLYAQSENPRVVIAAFKALSHFSVEHFKLSHFKYKIVEDFVLQAKAVLDQSETEEGSVDSIIPTPPGVCYIRLLQDINKQALTGFKSFLSSLVGREFVNLPRGIYYSSTRRHGTSSRLGKAVASIPGLIQTQYQSTQQPGVRPGLAAGLLFCYDPAVAVSRDGRPRLHYTMAHGKHYQQTFQSLLNDVVILPTDWHMMALMPTAWSSFVDRLFGSMVMARKAELDLQRNRDFIDGKEADEKKMSAWMWVRDSLCDVIKKSSKGNPSVQANAILALAGLVNSTQRYVVSLDREERCHVDEITDHMTHSHWTMTVIDSCMSVVDFTFEPKSSLIGLCQQRSVEDRLPASILAQTAGILALAQLVPVLVTHYVENIYNLLDKLVKWLPGKQEDDDECPPVLHLCRGIAFGKFLARLVYESFSDVEGTKGSLTMMKSLDALEKCCFTDSRHRVGPMVGLGISLSAMAQDGKTDSRVHVSSVLQKLFDQLKGLDRTDDVYQVCCVTVAMVTSTGFNSNVIDMDMVNNLIDELKSAITESKQSQGTALPLGLLCHSLVIGGHPNIASTTKGIYSDWMKLSHDEESSPIEKLAAITGLMAISGSEKLFISINESTTDLPSDIKIEDVIKTTCQIVTTCDDVITKSSAAWLLGNLYLSLNSLPQSSSTVPANYSYLPEASVLRAIVEFLILASKQGPEYIGSEEVLVCIKALQDEVQGSLPPLNWASLLSPLIKLPFGDEVRLQCVQLALKQCSSSSSATLFISSWCVMPLYNTLPISCQMEILSKADVIMKSVTPTVFQNFLEKTCYSSVTDANQGRSLCLAALKGLNSALTVTDPPQSTVSMLYKTTTKVFACLAAENDTCILQCLSECLGHLPVEMFDEITSGDCTDNQTVERGVYVRSYLVGKGLQPIALLNSCIDSAFNIECDHDKVLYYLCSCFYKMTQTDSVHTRVIQRVQWLLEIMGHVKNIATGSYPVALPTQKVIEFGVDIVSAVVCGWTNKVSAAVFDLNLQLLDPPSESIIPDTFNYKLAVRPLAYLRNGIANFEKEPWSQILPKILDWLLTMIDLPETVVSPEIKGVFKDCVHVLRTSSDYAKVAVWTRAVAVY